MSTRAFTESPITLRPENDRQRQYAKNVRGWLKAGVAGWQGVAENGRLPDGAEYSARLSDRRTLFHSIIKRGTALAGPAGECVVLSLFRSSPEIELFSDLHAF